MDVQVLGPVEASVDGRPDRPRRGQAARAAGDAGAQRRLHGLDCASDRRALGRAPAGDGDQDRPGVRVPAAQGARSERGRRGDRHARPRLRAAARIWRRRCRAFERLVAQAAPREALALWRGPPLDDVADEPFAAAEIRRLEELRLAAVELAIENDLARGRHREVLGELEALVAASRCASGCTRSGCWRCTAAAGRPTRWPPTVRRGRRWWRRSASSRGRSCGACTRRSCARIRRLSRRRWSPSSCRRSSTWGRRWRAVRRTWSGCASSGAARAAALAGSCWSRARAGSARRGSRPSWPARCIATAARCSTPRVRARRTPTLAALASARAARRLDAAGARRRRPRRPGRAARALDELHRAGWAMLPVLVVATAEDADVAPRAARRRDAVPRTARRRSGARRSPSSMPMSGRTQRRPPSGSSETAAGSRSGCIDSPPSGRAPRRRGV